MKQLFSLSFLCSLFGTYFLLATSTLVCMHNKQPLPPLSNCLVVAQAVLHKQPLTKPKTSDTLANPKKCKEKIILPTLNFSSLNVVRKSASDAIPSNVKNSYSSQKKPLTNLFPHSQEPSQSPLLVSARSSAYSFVQQLEEDIKQPSSSANDVLALFYAGVFETDDEASYSLDSQSSCENSPRKKRTGYNQ